MNPSMSPLEIAQQLRREADELLYGRGLDGILRAHGRVFYTGSYALDAMAWPDVDINMLLEPGYELVDGGLRSTDPLNFTDIKPYKQRLRQAQSQTGLDDAILNTPNVLDYHETVEKGHGRVETRRCWHSEHLDWFADRPRWEGLRSVGVVESVRETKGVVQTERRYFLSSLPCAAARFARAVRSHWGVENQLHWVLDVQFGEDQSRARAGFAAENLATLRRLALNLLKRESTKKRGIRGKQKIAGWDHRYLLRLLGAPATAPATQPGTTI